MMNGYDIELFNFFKEYVDKPIILNGGAGNLNHFNDLFKKCYIQAVAASSIFYFTKHTPNDIKNEIKKIKTNVRI
jgi:cyclase